MARHTTGFYGCLLDLHRRVALSGRHRRSEPSPDWLGIGVGHIGTRSTTDNLLIFLDYRYCVSLTQILGMVTRQSAEVEVRIEQKQPGLELNIASRTT